MAQFAEPVVSFLLESITKLLIEEGKHLLGVSDKAQQLQSELRLMLSLVKSADQRQDEDAVLREWISQSRDLAYEVENVLETLAFRIASKNVLKRSMCIFSESYVQHNVGLEIEALNNRVTNLTRRFHEFGIRAILGTEGPSLRQQQLIRRTYSHVEEEDFVGLENDVRMLVQALVNTYKVVSICGMGGLGKTTIARKVYNHPDVKHNFDSFAWVCVSQQWQTKDILVRILLKLIPERRLDIPKWENDDLVRELYQVQHSKKCLIVLDDIWSLDAWECMRNAFGMSAKGSKLLLTTRNKDVAIHIGPNGFHHEPRLLSKDESWKLLQKKALRERTNFHGNGDMHKFEDLGKEMVEYCRGLPLAVVVLGGILATKYDFNEWEFVCKNVKSYLRKSEIIGQEAEGEVQRILALSYNDLPYKLKPCFLYLGIYPEDCEIETETLYQLWMSEGMVSEADRIGEESMMDTAERYLGELAKRSMVQVKEKKRPGIRSFGSCRLHDLMRDLCLRKGGEENFMKVIDYRCGDHTESADSGTSLTVKIQRLVVFLSPHGVFNYRPPKKEVVKHVRSLTYTSVGGRHYGWRLAKTRLKNFKMLRALTLENVGWVNVGRLESCLCNIPSTVDLRFDNLVHMRYLSLRNSDYRILQSSMSKLQHLETLDLRNVHIKSIRNINVLRLRNLRYLYLPKIATMHWSIKLRLAGLTKLEILFNLRNCYVEDLKKLTNLQVLNASTHENDGKEITNCILNLPQLKHVDLRIFNWKSSRKLEQLFCSNIQHLSLTFYPGKLIMLPEYRTHFLKCLIELELRGNLLIHRDSMETLEKLPNLRRLWMSELSFAGKEMTCHSMGFPQLTFLSFDYLDKLENWMVEEGAMPSLSRLRISRCLELKMIPDGIRYIITLKELVIENMPSTFDDRIRVTNGQEGKDFDKVSHVASIVIR